MDYCNGNMLYTFLFISLAVRHDHIYNKKRIGIRLGCIIRNFTDSNGLYRMRSSIVYIKNNYIVKQITITKRVDTETVPTLFD